MDRVMYACMFPLRRCSVTLPCLSIPCDRPCCLSATVEGPAPSVLPALQNDGRPRSFKRSNVAAHIFVSSPAIEKSWTTAFVGDSPIEGLKQHITTQLQSELQTPEPYCSIIQSSGMGGLLDEFSTDHFMIRLTCVIPKVEVCRISLTI
jgi:hypothetical protein